MREFQESIERKAEDREPGKTITAFNPDLEVLLSAAQLKRRWGGCSDMLLWRRLHDDPDMPSPLRMRGRRYWYLSAIMTYERLLAERQAAA